MNGTYIVLTLLLTTSGTASAAQNMITTSTADALIQAGHEGRPDCTVEPPSLCRNTGASRYPGEINWTPQVADEATRVLRSHGIKVLRMPGYLPHHYNVKVAVYLHFDASADPKRPCNAHSSVGYPKDIASRSLAQDWKALYDRYWPYRFAKDNYTSNLSGYYGYHHVTASKGQLLIEGGEMSCNLDYNWLSPRLKFLGDLVAYFISREIGRGNVPAPRA